MPELGSLGSVRGALSNERPYRDLRYPLLNGTEVRQHLIDFRSATTPRRIGLAAGLIDLPVFNPKQRHNPPADPALDLAQTHFPAQDKP